MAQAPVMPLWTDALIADTTHLSPREFGCYMLLLIATWRNNGHPFADNDKILARICRITTYEWKSQIRKNVEPFFNLSDGYWRQKRLEKEWAFCSAKARISRSNGAMGGRPAKAKPSKLNGTKNPAGSSQVNPEGTQKEPALNLNQVGSEEPTPQRGRQAAVVQDFERFYALYPRHEAKGDARRAYQAARKKASAAEIEAGAQRYAAVRNGEDRRYTAYPATWLNDERWLDQPDLPLANGHDTTPPAPINPRRMGHSLPCACSNCTRWVALHAEEVSHA